LIEIGAEERGNVTDREERGQVQRDEEAERGDDLREPARTAR
jgi:hypothetical protein